MKIIQLCPACFLLDKPKSDSLSIKLVKISNFEDVANFGILITTGYPGTSDMLLWKFMGQGNEDSALSLTLNNLVECDNLPGLSERTPLLDNPLHRAALAYAHAWRAILRNYSIRIDPISCQNGFYSHSGYISEMYSRLKIILKPHPYVKTLYFFPTFAQDELRDLRFISCGEKELVSLSYHELVNIFDVWVWIAIVLSMIALMIVTTNISLDAKDIVQKWMNLIRVLIEQGSPFGDQVTLRLRSVLGMFMLMGMVLSCAYKNVNVYNMLTPRKPIPYEYFRELVTDKFTVLTRTNEVLTWASFAEDEKSVKIDSEMREGVVTAISYYNEKIVLKSEVAAMISSWSLVHEELVPWQDLKSTDVIMKSSIVTSGVRDVATISPGMQDYVIQIVTNYRSHKIQYHDLHEDGVDFKKHELDALLRFMEKCDKTAAVLPEYLCKKFAKTVKREKHLNNVFIGKESFSEIVWLFSFAGLVPPHLVQRFNWFTESGIYERWITLVKGGQTYGKESENIPVTAANMQGNIVVIFLVWVCGQLVAVICGAVEISLAKIRCILTNFVRFEFSKRYIALLYEVDNCGKSEQR